MNQKSRMRGFLAALAWVAVVVAVPAGAIAEAETETEVETKPHSGVGLGAYLSLTPGAFGFTLEPDSSSDIDGDGDLLLAGGGFALDTAVSGDAIFGYRLNLGFQFGGADIDYDIGGSDDLGLVGVVLDHDFGFRLFGNESVRLWLGPTLRVGALIGEFDDDADLFDDDDDQVDLAALAIGVGPVLGANINLGKRFALSFSGGVRADFYAGKAEDDFDNDIDFVAAGPTFFVRAAFLVRLP